MRRPESYHLLKKPEINVVKPVLVAYQTGLNWDFTVWHIFSKFRLQFVQSQWSFFVHECARWSNLHESVLLRIQSFVMAQFWSYEDQIMWYGIM